MNEHKKKQIHYCQSIPLFLQNILSSSGHIRKIHKRWLLRVTPITLFRTFYQPCVSTFNVYRYEKGYLTEVG